MPEPRFRRSSHRSRGLSEDAAALATARLHCPASSQRKEKHVKTVLSAMFALSLLSGSAAMAQESKEAAPARAAAEKWLKLVDAGDYAGAWNSSSADVRANTSKFFWTTLVGGVRMPLGDAQARSLKAARAQAEGSTVTLEYASRFENDKKASETITAVREKDGSWRVAGYSVEASTGR